MAFRLVGQWATDAARAMSRVPKHIKEYCQQIPLGPEGDYRHEVNVFHGGFVTVGLCYLLWAEKRSEDVRRSEWDYHREERRKLERN